MSHPLNRRALLGAGLAAGAAAAGAALASPASADEPTSRDRPVLVGRPNGDDLHVMSYNVRVPMDGPPHTWEERRPRVERLLRRERPTLLGMQESVYYQGRDILADLRGHDWIHLHREGGSEGEGTVVCYDTSRLEPTAYDHLWLSDTPRLIGSRDWGNQVIRMLTWVRFTDLRTDRELVVVNNHFDHQSDNSRERSAEMIRDLLPRFDVPVLVVGDFNAGTDSRPYDILVGDGDLLDSWTAAEERLTLEYGTFNGWNPEPNPNNARIDWILATPDVAVRQVGINTRLDEGHPPSDHWAVQALVHLT